jgi:hypothetical protein
LALLQRCKRAAANLAPHNATILKQARDVGAVLRMVKQLQLMTKLCLGIMRLGGLWKRSALCD